MSLSDAIWGPSPLSHRRLLALIQHLPPDAALPRVMRDAPKGASSAMPTRDEVEAFTRDVTSAYRGTG